MDSISKLKAEFQSIAQRHLQINSFGFGPADDYESALENDDSLFPNMWVEPQPNSGSDHVYSRNFAITILSVGPDSVELWSDTELIALDILATFKQDFANPLADLELEYSLTPLQYRNVDHAFGWSLDLSLTYPNVFNFCDVPNEAGDCLKIWNTSESTWNDAEQIWNFDCD
tara:strand:- start:522 stop:1037 length:516 start_codon:yes stop_codon:yes gene_type:complete